MAALTFGDTGKKSGWYSHDDVVQYIAKIKRLENQLGDAFKTAVSEKQKLAVVEKALPEGLRTIMKQSAPPAENGVVQQDTDIPQKGFWTKIRKIEIFAYFAW